MYLYCIAVASTPVMPEVVDLDNCLQEERLSFEKLSKLFEVPSAPVSSPVLKKSHSDGKYYYVSLTIGFKFSWFGKLIIFMSFNIT